jgi:hypothetical protein
MMSNQVSSPSQGNKLSAQDNNKLGVVVVVGAQESAALYRVVVAPRSKVASVLGSTLAAGQAEHPLQTAQEPCSPAHASTSQASSRQRQT